MSEPQYVWTVNEGCWEQKRKSKQDPTYSLLFQKSRDIRLPINWINQWMMNLFDLWIMNQIDQKKINFIDQ